jgi:hypothetical protein
MEQNNNMRVGVLPGIREDLEPHAAPPGTLTVARNVRFPTAGVVQSRRGLSIRSGVNGTTLADVEYPTLVSGSGPDFLHPCSDGFVFGAAGYGYRYSDTFGTQVAGSYSTAQPRGVLESMAREELTPSQATLRAPWPLSAAVANGLVAICHSVGNGQTVGVGVTAGTQREPSDGYSATAGAVIRILTEGGTLIASGYWDDMQSAMVVTDPLDNKIAIVYQNGTDLRVRTINASGVVGSSVSIGTLSTSTSYYAACSWPGVGVGIVYQSAAGVLTVMKVTANAVTGGTTIAITAGAGTPVSAYADAANLYVGWALRGGGSYDAQARVFNPALTVTSGGTVSIYALGAATAYLGPPLFGANHATGSAIALVAYATGSSRADFNKTLTFKLTSAGVVDVGAVQYSATPLSAPFANGMWWARVLSNWAGGRQSQRNVLLDFQLSRGEASTQWKVLESPKIALLCDQFPSPASLSSVSTSENFYLQHLHTPVQLTNDEWVMGVPRVVRLETAYTTFGSCYLVLCEWLRFAVGCEQQARTVRDEVVVSGSPAVVNCSNGTTRYDSSGSAKAYQYFGLDLGMLQAPGIIVSSSATAGALVAGGVYQYRVVLEMIDSKGRRHRSAPSNVFPVTISPGHSSTVVGIDYSPTFLRSFTEEPSNSRVVAHLYRSLDGGENFQRASAAQGVPVVYTAGTINVSDLLGDTELAEREFLYTDGGALQHDHAPSCRFLAATEDRLWLAGLWDRFIAQSSKIIVPGEPIQFSDSPAFQVVCPDPITGLASQDGLVMLFAESAIYVVQGIGPNDQGQGAWDSPRCVTRSTGCIDWRSIVETSIGVFYQSERGIMLLPRGAAEPVFIGMPIEGLLESAGSVITGASVCQTSDGNTVRFCTSVGTIIYDLETQAWSLDTPPSSPSGLVHSKVCDALAGPVLARADPAVTSGYSACFDQETTATADEEAPIASYVEWAPIHPVTLAGWATFTGAISAFGKLDGASYPASPVTASCNVDSDTTNSKTMASMATMGNIDYRRLPLGQKRQGCAVTLSFATAAAPWRFVGWTLELENLQGTRNIAPNVEQY